MPPSRQASSSSGSLPANNGYNVGAMAAQALTSTLTNPYGQTQHSSYTNANYYSYFTQRPMTTPEGYTLSSTYVPNMRSFDLTAQPHMLSPVRGRTRNAHPTQRPSRPFVDSSSSAPGSDKCTYIGCRFTGSKKTVEIHMMDRHLIFPPGWKKKSGDWDADPSLKGKPVPIPGTGVTLNTPEAIDAWIAERKKKWPSKGNIEDKKRKAQEAADRGEITPSELMLNSRKRRNLGDTVPEWERGGRGRGRGRGRGKGPSTGSTGWGRERGRGYPRRSDSGWRGRGQSTSHVSSKMSSDEPGTRGVQERKTSSVSSSDDDASETSGSDMDPVKDAMSSKIHKVNPESRIPDANPDQEVGAESDPPVDVPDPSKAPHHPFQGQKLAPRPKQPPRNFLVTKSSLLRNLLLPEIRHTVSNLSQAIHFLVENNFLEGVELKPGDADSQPIKVLKSSSLPAILNNAGANCDID